VVCCIELKSDVNHL